jgi:Domain of unknown function (DUF2017)
MARNRRLVRRKGTDRYELQFPEWLREELGNLLGQLRQLLTGDAPDDDRLTRLFPNAYVGNPEAEAEYQGFMRAELVTSRVAAISIVEESLFDEAVDGAKLNAWMAAINDVRLVLGTLLGVSEEADHGEMEETDPNFGGFVLYDQLTFVLGEIIDALSEGIGDAAR